jgi:DNA primase
MAKTRQMDIEEIRRQTDLVEVVSAHVALKGSGHRMRGLCPFHEEKTPSFYVDSEKGLWHCFSCKAGGDAFKFVEQMQGLNFAEAAQWLARRLGGEFRQRNAQQATELQRLANMNADAAAFFRRLLAASEGKAARDYLEKREITPDVVLRFGLGYAPAEWSELFRLLKDKGFKEEEIYRSGLCLKRQSGGGYDRFRNRLIFQIHDLQERIVGFGGRALTAEDEPKYLNSSETPLFQKGQTLYGLPWAARSIASSKRAIIVEGYFDLIRCHVSGIEEAVATLGTALTASHLDLLRRRQTERVLLAFDSDSAGMQAALRSREIFANSSMKVAAVSLPPGQDPDSFILSDGPEALEGALSTAKPLLELTLEGIANKYVNLPANQRTGMLQESAKILGGISDLAERQYYVSWLAEKYCGEKGKNLSKVEQILVSQISSLQRSRKDRAAGFEPEKSAAAALAGQVSEMAPLAKLERLLLACILANPAALLEAPELIRVEDFSEPANQSLAEGIIILMERGEAPAAEALNRHFAESEMRSLVAELALRAEPWMDQTELFKLIKMLRAAGITQRRRELSLLLENEREEGKRKLLQAEIHALAREKSRQVGRWVVGE